MSEQKDASDPNNQAEGATQQHYEQPWREERHQPEPQGIEGHHAGQAVPEDMQRPTMDNTGVGRDSRVAGDDSGGGRGYEGGLAVGTSYGNAGASGSHQGSTDTPGGRTGTTHSRGHGRDAEGAFGEETGGSNANAESDIRDAGIAKRVLGGSDADDRTQGGDQ